MLAFRGRRNLRGNGLGGIFSWLKRNSIPILKQLGNYLGGKVLNVGGNVLSDLQAGEPIKEAIKTRVTESSAEIMAAAKERARKARKLLLGRGKKGQKNKPKKKSIVGKGKNKKKSLAGKGKNKKKNRPPVKKQKSKTMTAIAELF